MSDDSDSVTWLQSVEGDRLGVQPASIGGMPVVRLIFPEGTVRTISASEAPRIVSMLLDGIKFAEIMGIQGFTLSPDEL